MRKRRGIVITTETLAITAILLIILFALFAYLQTAMPREVKEKRAILDVKLCGRVVTVKNVGNEIAYVTKATAFTESGVQDVSASLIGAYSPGETKTIILSIAPKKLTIVGINFQDVVVDNDCYP